MFEGLFNQFRHFVCKSCNVNLLEDTRTGSAADLGESFRAREPCGTLDPASLAWDHTDSCCKSAQSDPRQGQLPVFQPEPVRPRLGWNYQRTQSRVRTLSQVHDQDRRASERGRSVRRADEFALPSRVVRKYPRVLFNPTHVGMCPISPSRVVKIASLWQTY